jgi:hypothetical protein
VLMFLVLRPTPWAAATDTTASGGPIKALKGQRANFFDVF